MRSHRSRLAAGAALAAVAVIVLGSEAEATTQITTTFRVQAQIYTGCTFTPNNLVFTTLAINQATPAPGQTTFTITCPGVGVGSPVGPRPVRFTMTTATGNFIMQEQATPRQLPYELCNDAPCTQVYANGVQGPSVSGPRPRSRTISLARFCRSGPPGEEFTNKRSMPR